MKRARAAEGTGAAGDLGGLSRPGSGVAAPTPAATVMIQGTASGVGKSLVTAALCRIFAEDGRRVAPFKAWNMALNSAVTPDGAEIGRSQALQAEAAGIVPTAHNNPVLLKPAGGSRCQVVVHGRVYSTGDYGTGPGAPAGQAVLWKAIRASLAVLRARYEVVVLEGAGSPAELNLRGRDLANMRTARLAGAPVLLVADISRGGVFAALIGTLQLLPPADRRRVVGLIVNNFHGDPAFFREGAALLERRARRPVLGVLPHLPDLGLDEEDAVALWQPRPRGDGPLQVAVVRLPHLANFTDTDVLRYEPDVDLAYTADPGTLAAAALIVLPGSQDTLGDLDWLHRTGLGAHLRRLAAGGTRLIGLGIESCQVNTLEASIFMESAEPDLLLQDMGLGVLSTDLSIETMERRSGRRVRDLADWHGVIDWSFDTYGRRAVAVKSAAAYGRRLDYRDVDADTAAPLFERHLRGQPLEPGERRALEDHLFRCCLRRAEERALPVKLHCGYYAGTGTMPLGRVRDNAADVCALLHDFPEAKFVLMHIGYPYQDEYIALAKHYPGAHIDLCWAWIVNPAATVRFVREYLLAAPANKLLCFGGDYTTVENVAGHAAVARQGLSLALRSLVGQGWLREADATALVADLMAENARTLFGLDGAGRLARGAASA